jgi:hypothetical protein
MATFQELLSDKAKYTDDTKITLTDGAEVTLGDLRKGHMMESDYRKKTSDVSRARQDLEAEQQRFEAARIQAQTQLEELASQVLAKKPGSTESEVDAELEANPLARKLMGKVGELTGRLAKMEEATTQLYQGQQQFKQNMLVNEHRKVLEKLKADDAELDTDALVKFAKDNYVPRLDIAYKAFKHDELMARAAKDAASKARAEGVEEGKRAMISPTLPQRVRFMAPDLPKDAPRTMDEAANAASQDPEILGLLTQGS